MQSVFNEGMAARKANTPRESNPYRQSGQYLEWREWDSGWAREWLEEAGVEDKRKKFTIYSDPGHGWLKVTRADMEAIGLKPESFSRCSYRKPDDSAFYLEEDCDALLFVQTYAAKHGASPQINASNCNGQSFIRRLPPIHNLPLRSELAATG